MTDATETFEVPLDTLLRIVDKSLVGIGVPAGDVPTIRDVLMYAELRGNNQGLVKIPARGVLPSADATPIEMIHPMPCSAHIRVNGNSGMIVAVQAADEAARLAETHGVGIVGTSGRGTSTGAIGYYARRIAGQGLVGIVMSGSPKAVAPSGGVDPALGTNPLAIAVPTRSGPVVLDMTTASMAWYGLIQAKNRGQSIPDGIAYDGDGAPTTDPAAALQGAIRAFAGHKGAGLALMIEFLTGPLLDAGITGDPAEAPNSGDLFLAINPAALGGAESFTERVDTLIGRVKAGRRLPGHEEIVLPGELGDRRSRIARESNRIRIDKALYEELVRLAEP